MLDKDSISRVTFFFGECRICKDIADAGAALVKKGDLSAAEAIEVFHESRFPDAREFLARTWDFARKMIEQLQARGGGGAGVVDQGAVNVEEDHGVKIGMGIAQIIDWCRPFGNRLLVQAFQALKRWAKVGRPSAPVLWRAPRQVLLTILSCCNESCLINPILR